MLSCSRSCVHLPPKIHSYTFVAALSSQAPAPATYTNGWQATSCIGTEGFGCLVLTCGVRWFWSSSMVQCRSRNEGRGLLAFLAADTLHALGPKPRDPQTPTPPTRTKFSNYSHCYYYYYYYYDYYYYFYCSYCYCYGYKF